jgi:AraC family transcriptional regulator
MVVKALPDPALINNSSHPGLQNEVINARTMSRYQYPNHTTPFLFIANFNGTGYYQVNSRHVSINDRLFYFLNAGDKVEINFKNQKPLETLLILFSEEFINGWADYKRTSISRMLANGVTSRISDWAIPNIPFEYNPVIINQLKIVKACDAQQDLDNALFELLESFWILKEGSKDNLKNIAAKRKSTREEIYRRLVVAKIFMHDNFADSPTVAEIAAEACLDKFHFLKLFKNLHGITPHQYLVKLKLQHAYDLLATGRFTVMEACQQVGFVSQGTFANLFKKYYNVPPSALFLIPTGKPCS